MQLFKRLLRAQWSAISLILLSFSLILIFGIWVWRRLLVDSLAPSMRPVFWWGLGLGALLLAVLALKNRMMILMVAIVIPKLRASRPRLERTATLKCLDQEVIVTFDRFGIPTIKAQSRLDAIRGLGYVSARDRFFQMDLLRRAAAGRLTEVFGKGLLEMDTSQRVVGCNRVAPEIVSRLPEVQKEILEAYSDGVNAYLSQMKSRPFELLLLKYQPDTWTSTDSVLALLQMFQNLSAEEEGKQRTLAIMESTLPAEVVAFLTPDTDPFTTVLGWGRESHRPIRSLPLAELASLVDRRPSVDDATTARKIVKTEGLASGSNCWAVGKSKTANGAAMLANDMHTGLAVPNLWYRARLCYDDVDLSGVIIPGIPMVLAGSNTHVAWGLTNMLGACLDLVQLEIDPERTDHYMTTDGFKPFELINEPIRLKRGDIVNVEVKKTTWGPVLEKTLMGKQVALHWTALDPDCVDFGLMQLERARTVEEAASVINRFAGPPLNVIVADERGRIAYTLCGKFPVRNKENTTRVCGNSSAAWTGYIHPDELPRIVESPDGFLVNANNMSVGKEYPYLLGQGFPHSYRAYRITERLREMSGVTEADMAELQFDVACEVYEFYGALALAALTDQVVATNGDLGIVREAILAWDGRAAVESYGLVFLIYFRESLAQSIFTPILRTCAEADEQFVYAWPNLDTPLRIILTEKPPELLIEPDRHATWDDLIVANLESSIRQLKATTKVKSLKNLNWGKFNKAEIFHPLAQQDRSFAGRLLNMPQDSLPGCIFSVCSSEPGFGASIRMVVSPNLESAGLLQIACGQSGHPLSDNYDDQNAYWARKEPLPFLPGRESHALILNARPQS